MFDADFIAEVLSLNEKRGYFGCRAKWSNLNHTYILVKSVCRLVFEY